MQGLRRGNEDNPCVHLSQRRLPVSFPPTPSACLQAPYQPPRQVTNHVIMNNGQPSLVELTQTTSTTNPSPKAIIKHSQKSAQDPSFRSKKGIVLHVSLILHV